MAISHHLQVRLSRFKALINHSLIWGDGNTFTLVFGTSFVCLKVAVSAIGTLGWPLNDRTSLKIRRFEPVEGPIISSFISIVDVVITLLFGATFVCRKWFQKSECCWCFLLSCE